MEHENDPLRLLAKSLMKPSDQVLAVIFMVTKELIASGAIHPVRLRFRLRRTARKLDKEDDRGTRNTMLNFAAALPSSGRSRKAKRMR